MRYGRACSTATTSAASAATAPDRSTSPPASRGRCQATPSTKPSSTPHACPGNFARTSASSATSTANAEPHRGRGWFDYRPGTSLADFLAINVKNPDVPGANKAVGHTEQMRKSRCFVKTPANRKLGCTSCHDPHQHVEPRDKVRHYRQRCLTCHQEKGCPQPRAERVKKVPTDSCIDCHMPRGA